jgi:iron complex transport system substrate-binding protein
MRLLLSMLLLAGFAVSAAEPGQIFTDDLGRKVTVPQHPQRIVSLHDLDITIPLIELGVPPVASHGRTRPDGSHFLRSSGMLTGVDFDNSTIRFIGTADIDIEAIAAVKPDLIITEPTRNTPVEQLEKIAPTVSIDHLDGGAPEIYRKLAQLTGTQARLAILERRYEEQIKALKATLDTRKIKVSAKAITRWVQPRWRRFTVSWATSLPTCVTWRSSRASTTPFRRWSPNASCWPITTVPTAVCW